MNENFTVKRWVGWRRRFSPDVNSYIFILLTLTNICGYIVSLKVQKLIHPSIHNCLLIWDQLALAAGEAGYSRGCSPRPHFPAAPGGSWGVPSQDGILQSLQQVRGLHPAGHTSRRGVQVSLKMPLPGLYPYQLLCWSWQSELISTACCHNRITPS